jgi:hypothetical protein
MLQRILASLVLLLSILFWPFWVSLILALAGIIYFNIFWEAMALFLLADLLFGAREVKWNGFIFTSFVLVSIVLIIAEITKKKLKFYR